MYLARSILAVLFFFSSVGAVKAVFASEDSSSIDLIIIVAIVLFTGIVALRKGNVLFAASFYLLKQDVMRVSLAAARPVSDRWSGWAANVDAELHEQVQKID